MIAVGLLSGGLDSTMAAKMMIDQGFTVHAVNFVSPFCTCTPKSAGCSAVVTAVKQLGGIHLERIVLGDEYLEMVKAPKHGHGRGLNPCIDCRIMKLRRAGEYMKSVGGEFLFTGEVLGQRPMSQHRRALEIIEDESGFKGYVLRPLSAQFLEPTLPELKGIVDRNKLLDIAGRSRKVQLSYAVENDITEYQCAGGGCLLTDSTFAGRLKEYLAITEKPSRNDMPLLRIGRHIALDNGEKAVVARTEEEGEKLIRIFSNKGTLLLPLEFSGPIVYLTGSDIQRGIQLLVSYTNRDIPDNARILVKDGLKEYEVARAQWPEPSVRPAPVES